MKILIVTNTSTLKGGANKSLLGNIRVLRKKYDAQITLITPKKKGDLIDAVTNLGVKCFSSLYWGVVSERRHDGLDFLRILKMHLGYFIEKVTGFFWASYFKKQKFDCVYTNTRIPMLGANIAKRLRIPHVIHIRELINKDSLFCKWDYLHIYEKSDKIIHISNAGILQFRENNVPLDKCVLSYNGVNYPSVIYNYKKFSKIINICICGTICPEKGQMDAVRAIVELNKNGILFNLYIAGSPISSPIGKKYLDDLHIFVSENKADKYVYFDGEIQNMVDYRAKMDIELVCSRFETFGRVTVEAMRSGLVVIAANSGGTLELINDSVNGYLYSQGDYLDLARTIAKAVQDIDFFNIVRKNAIYYSSSNFGVEKNCDEIYNTICSLSYKGD